MKIIVTGGNGFVGSHTITALKEKGYDILNFDLPKYDIQDYRQVEVAIEKGDKVLHLAAIARFADADNNPLRAYRVNVFGTENIAKACRMKDAERLVYSSTGSVYMPIEQEPPITEDFKCRGNSVYACSKFIAEEIIRKLDVPHIILRYAHLYGAGKEGHGAIGGFISRMKEGLAPRLYGGKQSNDFTYIKDIVQANLLALETDSLNQTYNIGTGEELTTEGVFKILADFFDYHKEFERLPIRVVDPLRFVFDISKAKRELGYKPEYNFKHGIEDWLK